MKSMIAYLTFNGNCRQAIDFYKKCLGAEVDILLFSQAPCQMPKDQQDRIMHAHLRSGSAELMASDSMSSAPMKRANNFSVAVHCDSEQELETLFAALAEGGSVTVPPQNMFWGARFGSLTDQFGIHWIFNYFFPK